MHPRNRPCIQPSMHTVLAQIKLPVSCSCQPPTRLRRTTATRLISAQVTQTPAHPSRPSGHSKPRDTTYTIPTHSHHRKRNTCCGIHHREGPCCKPQHPALQKYTPDQQSPALLHARYIPVPNPRCIDSLRVSPCEDCWESIRGIEAQCRLPLCVVVCSEAVVAGQHSQEHLHLSHGKRSTKAVPAAHTAVHTAHQ